MLNSISCLRANQSMFHCILLTGHPAWLQAQGRARRPSREALWGEGGVWGGPFRGVLCPWNSLSNNTGVGCHALLQAIFPTKGSNPSLTFPASSRQALYHLCHLGTPILCIIVYLCQSQSPNSSHILLILMITVSLFSISLTQFLLCK